MNTPNITTFTRMKNKLRPQPTDKTTFIYFCINKNSFVLSYLYTICHTIANYIFGENNNVLHPVNPLRFLLGKIFCSAHVLHYLCICCIYLPSCYHSL